MNSLLKLSSLLLFMNSKPMMIRKKMLLIMIPLFIICWGCKQNGEVEKEVIEKDQVQDERVENGQKNAAEKVEEATKGGNPMVILSTSKGDIKIELYKDKAPITVDNFLSYANEKFYDGTIFHRVIPSFMIQAGGFTADMSQKPTKPPIKNEADNGLRNERGTIVMARTNIIDSATSQFFINQVNNDFLNHGDRDFGYAVFGKVVEGMDVVDQISAVKTGSKGMHRDVPLEEVIVESVKVVEPE